MHIQCDTLEGLTSTIALLVKNGLGFTANIQTLKITLTGAY